MTPPSRIPLTSGDEIAKERDAMLDILREQLERSLLRPTLPTWPDLHELQRETIVRRTYR